MDQQINRITDCVCLRDISSGELYNSFSEYLQKYTMILVTILLHRRFSSRKFFTGLFTLFIPYATMGMIIWRTDRWRNSPYETASD
jgi:hypothetical protein